MLGPVASASGTSTEYCGVRQDTGEMSDGPRRRAREPREAERAAYAFSVTRVLLVHGRALLSSFTDTQLLPCASAII